ncbi:hypothetical protein N9B82_02510 [Saprospiraceae bacterium]|nr:hypothetical protein [Saprospiraceae bacterium]
MLRKTLFIISAVLALILMILIAITVYLKTSEKAMVDEYAIEYSIERYEKERTKLNNSNLAKLGEAILNKFDPTLKAKIQKTDSIVRETFEMIDDESSLHLDKLADLKQEDLESLVKIKALSDFEDSEYVKNYVSAKYLLTQELIYEEILKFLLCNLFVLVLIGGISIYKELPDEKVLIPIILLMISTLVSMGMYIFSTNWFWKIILGSFAGYGYLWTIIFIFILLNMMKPGKINHVD